MPFDPKVHVGVAGIIINPKGEMLALKRTGSTGVGTWGLVGGWIDYREHPKEALLREIQEELDIIALHPEIHGSTTHTWDEAPDTVVTIFYKFRWMDHYTDAINAEETKATELGWLSFHELISQPLFPPLRNYIQEGFRY